MLPIMAGDMLQISSVAVEQRLGGALWDKEDSILDLHVLPCHPRSAYADREREDTRKIRLRKTHHEALLINL